MSALKVGSSNISDEWENIMIPVDINWTAVWADAAMQGFSLKPLFIIRVTFS